MGKATIQSSLGEGQYNILYHRNVARIDARIAKIQAEVLTLNTVDLPVYAIAKEQAETALSGFIAALNTAILTEDKEAMTVMTSYAQTARMQAEAAKSELDNLKLKILSLEKEIEFLQNNKPADEAMQAWCTDLNEGLSGVVGTIEVPGEVTAPIIIKPGGTAGDQAGFAQATDGFMTPGLGISPEEGFYNLALMPGWQKWQPTYRIGTITALDADTCDVNLDPATSSQDDLNVNKQDIWGNVPIEYMSCNGSAFEVGDRVVVKFSPIGDPHNLYYVPKVIGFEANPQPCGFKLRLYHDDGFELVDNIRFRVWGSEEGTNIKKKVTGDVEYNWAGGYWMVGIIQDPTIDTAQGYWIDYIDKIERGVWYGNFRCAKYVIPEWPPLVMENMYHPIAFVKNTAPTGLPWLQSVKVSRGHTGSISYSTAAFGSWTLKYNAAAKSIYLQVQGVGYSGTIMLAQNTKRYVLEFWNWDVNDKYICIFAIDYSQLPGTDTDIAISDVLDTSGAFGYIDNYEWAINIKTQYPGMAKESEMFGANAVFVTNTILQDTLGRFKSDVTLQNVTWYQGNKQATLLGIDLKSSIDYSIYYRYPSGFDASFWDPTEYPAANDDPSLITHGIKVTRQDPALGPNTTELWQYSFIPFNIGEYAHTPAPTNEWVIFTKDGQSEDVIHSAPYFTITEHPSGERVHSQGAEYNGALTMTLTEYGPPDPPYGLPEWPGYPNGYPIEFTPGGTWNFGMDGWGISYDIKIALPLANYWRFDSGDTQ